MDEKLNRRSFLKVGSAMGIALGSNVFSPSNENNKPIVWGIIGVGNRGTGLMKVILQMEGNEISAVCDIEEEHLKNAVKIVNTEKGKEPSGYSDYKEMLKQKDIDAILIATPIQLHASMAVDALRAGKNVLSEVAAAATIDECWALVNTVEKTKKIYMLSENACYLRQNMMVSNMVRQGIFGDLTYSECGYVHQLKELLFNPDGSLTWRGMLTRDILGTWYPTHAIGPICQWLGINRGDRLKTLTAFRSKQASLKPYIAKNFNSKSSAAQSVYRAGDTTSTLVETEKGALINVRFDILSNRPHPNTTHHTLQGATASYEDRNNQQLIWMNGKSEKFAWEPLDKYADAYEHPLWKKWATQAKAVGHAGSDYFVIYDFTNAVRTESPSPIDVYDAVVWSSLIPLSDISIKNSGIPVEIPDFTKGKYKERRG